VTATTRRDALLLVGVVGLAAVLRAAGIGYGLPFPLLNPDEQSIVPRAWEMANGGGLDPGWYDYPSLLMLALVPTQAFSSEASYGAARGLVLLVGLAGVVATWWLGRAAYGRWSALVGAAAIAVATTHVAYSRMAVTDTLLMLGVCVTLALLVTGRIEWAGLALGVTASAKYPGALLAVPLVVASWRRWQRLLRAGGLAIAGFALTSPFVIIHAGTAWHDVRRVQRLGEAGWLGFEDDSVTPFAFLVRLWEAVGPVLAIGCLVLVVALRRRSRADVVLVSFVAVYWLSLMPLEAHFDRYVLPLVPVLAVLAGSVRAAAPFALVLLLVPLVWSVGDARRLTGEDTRVHASRWIDANVPQHEVIAADPSTLPLAARNALRLRLPGPGRPEDPRRALGVLQRAGVRWVLVTGAVADRVASHPELYPRTAAFYRDLSRRAELAFAATDDEPGLTGPWVRVYRLVS